MVPTVVTAVGLIFLFLERSAAEFLRNQRKIFNIFRSARIKDSEAAFSQFTEYFNSITERYQSLDQAETFKQEIENFWLPKFIATQNDLNEKALYDAKIRVRALYASLFIQLTVHLYQKAIPGYLDLMRNRMLTVLEIVRTNPSSEYKWSPLLDLSNVKTDIVISMTRFFIGLIFGKEWRTHAGWKEFAMYVASLSTGEGIWYYPGTIQKEETKRRVCLFNVIDNIFLGGNPVMVSLQSLLTIPQIGHPSPGITSSPGIEVNTHTTLNTGVANNLEYPDAAPLMSRKRSRAIYCDIMNDEQTDYSGHVAINTPLNDVSDDDWFYMTDEEVTDLVNIATTVVC